MANAIQSGLLKPVPFFGYKGDEVEDGFVNINAKHLHQLKDHRLAEMGTPLQVKEKVAAVAPPVIFHVATYLLLSFYVSAIFTYLNSAQMYATTVVAANETRNLYEKFPDVSGAVGSAAGTAAQALVTTAHNTKEAFKCSLEDRSLLGTNTFAQTFQATRNRKVSIEMVDPT